MKTPWTVLLQYPDYISDNRETYFTWVRAETPAEAAELARIKTMSGLGVSPEEAVDPIDFDCLLILPGHLPRYSQYQREPVKLDILVIPGVDLELLDQQRVTAGKALINLTRNDFTTEEQDEALTGILNMLDIWSDDFNNWELP